MKKCGQALQPSKIMPIENKCAKIHNKIISLQKVMKKIEKKSVCNVAWRGLLNSAVKGMNEALRDLEKRLEHIELELKEFMVFAFVFLLSGALFLNGCASLKERGKQVWGSSIEHLEKERSQGRAQDFALGIDECFLKVEELIADTDAQVYLKDRDKRYMAVMNFKGYVDTTQVGIFFTGSGPARTKIEVASMSPRLVDDVSEMIFEGLKAYKSE
ncbi:MAG TPA: hypothetical protein DCL35_08750 [Candidatus Omnitrophica bacterium]|nr:hypothetical protein [Candidatus Omnitrophota bacterium]